jgi:hypothetical protein
MTDRSYTIKETRASPGLWKTRLLLRRNGVDRSDQSFGASANGRKSVRQVEQPL